MCSNYEKQLQAIQGQEAETRDQVCVFSVDFLTFFITSNHGMAWTELPQSATENCHMMEWNLTKLLSQVFHLISNLHKKCSLEGILPFTPLQVKKLQGILRQANDQLERTMTEKQNLEDSVKVGNEETAAKVWTQWTC